VTITKHGALRGCIGYTTPVLPLYETVRDVAAFAATRDPRFPAVTESELSELEYEISVLSPLHYLNDPKTVRVGQDGLLLQRGRDGGLLLPQVPVEQKWDPKTFLEETSLKAGLDSDAWKDPETDMFAFTAVVFSDRKASRAEQPVQR
jgi:AmmeMemoRadiSam system protein A